MVESETLERMGGLALFVAADRHSVPVLTGLLARGRFDADPLEYRNLIGETPLARLLDPERWERLDGESRERVVTCIALFLVAGAKIPKNLSEAQNEMLEQARQRVDELKKATKEQLLEASDLPDVLA